MSYDFQRGVELLQQVDGRGGKDVIENLQSVSPDLGKYIIEYAFGEIYNREGLGLRDRELVTISSLAAMGDCAPQLKVHLNGALNCGITEEEIRETFLHLSLYCGFPKAINAILTAKEVFGNREM